jgi:exonuclease SbcC
MRPLRLLLDGFGCYRQPAEADFSDVDFFALVGPTGSGKSTLIDGLCFALYGTVPRWGKENVIADALAPAANACNVCLVFEASGKRYVAARALTRDKKGQVHTKNARLELLDPAIPPDAPLADILGASIEQIADGPDLVTSAVQDLLGLSYRHFTQSVLLPQGRFSEFLQATSGDRQKLLVELLAFGVYKEVGEGARERAKLAAERLRSARREREEVAGVTDESEHQAAARLAALSHLSDTLDAKLGHLARLTAEAAEAEQRASELRDEARLLSALTMPAEVRGLAVRIDMTDDLVAENRRGRDEAERAEAECGGVRDSLPDKTPMEAFGQVYAERRELLAQLERQEQDLQTKRAAESARAAELATAELRWERAQAAMAEAERTHAAIALAGLLRIGEDCPVCLRPVSSLPHHSVPADLARAQAAAETAIQDHKRAQAAHARAAQVAAVARSTVDSTRHQLDRSAAALAGAPAEPDVSVTLAAIAAADQALAQARKNATAARAALARAEQHRHSLGGEEQDAWARLRKTRDSLVSQVSADAPAVDGADLADAWQTLLAWASAQHAERSQRQPELEGSAADLRRRVGEETAAITALLAEHQIGAVTDQARVLAAVAGRRVQAENDLAAVRRDRQNAARLDNQILGYREEEQVATALGQLLRATSFERWLCSEALDSLVAEASQTLMKLSGGQYQLDRDDRNELVVIDYDDAGARRPVHTLSGGETFQASLALALALSRQVVGLSAGLRDLNSMFLDEGFGTLDEDTLETVATTLEQLAADSDRMVGVITHVHALADRVPVRLVVSRAGSTSVLRKERA